MSEFQRDKSENHFTFEPYIVTDKSFTSFAEVKEMLGKDSRATGPKIETKDGFYILYHLTSDVESLLQALNQDNLLTRPKGASWAHRCFGLGLACYTSRDLVETSQKARPDDQLVVLKVPIEKVTLVEKKQYFRMLTKFALARIEGDERLKKAFDKMLNLFKTDEDLSYGIDLITKRSKAFALTAATIDAFCEEYPQFSRLSVRQGIQSEYTMGNGKKAGHFGWRTYCDEAFLSPDEMIAALNFLLKHNHLTTSQVAELVRGIYSSMNIPFSDVFPEWDGKIDPQNPFFKLFIVLMLSNDRQALRTTLTEKGNSDKSMEKILQMLDGFFPIGDVPAPETSLVFGTDMGSNNIAVLRHYDPNLMTFKVLPIEQQEDK